MNVNDDMATFVIGVFMGVVVAATAILPNSLFLKPGEYRRGSKLYKVTVIAEQKMVPLNPELLSEKELA